VEVTPGGGLAVAAALALAAPAPARAEVTQASAAGFTSTFRAEIGKSPDEVWQAIVQLPRWWSDAHTYSGKASNLSLDARAGGCWCEQWDGGSVQHGRVVLAMPRQVLRVHGGLGPLQALPVDGVLDIVVGAPDGKTVLRMTYRVGGPPDTGLEKLAPMVDGVMATQFARLKALVETGKPD
jgi:uncharacterized protein YndB with AHSA1/START domain